MRNRRLGPGGPGELAWMLRQFAGFQCRYKLGREMTPPGLNFLVTLRCDMRCRHCFLRDRLEDPGEAREIGLAEIERMTGTMGHVFSLVLSGGEPFLRDELPEIVRLFCERARTNMVTILTDGQMPGRIGAAVEEILSISPPHLRLAVGVSLDGVGQRHDDIRRKAGAFDRAVRTVETIRRLSRSDGRLAVQTCSVLMGLNEDHIFDLYEYLRDDLRPHRIALNLIRADPMDAGAKPVNPETYGRLTRLIRQDTLSGRLRNRFPFDRFAFLTTADLTMMALVYRTLLESRATLQCCAGRVSGVIFPDGTVHACEMKPVWGTLAETGFHFSRFWSLHREKAAERGETPGRDCFCTHESNCLLPSIPFNWKLYPKLVVLWPQVMRGQLHARDRPGRLAVVIPALNEEAMIGGLLESLVQQHYRDFEVIVADSKSDDATCEVAEGFRDRLPALTIVQAEERGLALARNTGAAATTAGTLVFMDADGAVGPEFLEDLVTAMGARGLDVATTLVCPDSTKPFDRLFYRVFLGRSLRASQYFFPLVTGSCIAVKREVFDAVDGFDRAVEFEDSAFARRAARFGRFRVLAHPFVTTSVRRLDQYGRFRTLAKLVFFGVFRRLFGEMPAREGFYRFGEYDRKD